MKSRWKQTIPGIVRGAYWGWDNRLRVATEGKLYRYLRGTIASGPFKGMQYADISGGPSPAPKYLGVYEKELWPVLEEFTSSSPAPQGVIDIGAAEGYYAVGLLLRLPQLRMLAFEADADMRRLLSENALLNGVADRLTVRAFCEKTNLEEALTHFMPTSSKAHPWFIVDIEGGEKDLLDPSVLPVLRNCPILVELHDAMVPGCRSTLMARFSNSHRIREIHSTPRKVGDIAVPVPIRKWKLRRIIRERGDLPMSWFWMWPKSANEPCPIAS